MNNFDKSSTGENIEFSLYYSVDLAQMYYNDFKDGADGTPVKFYGKDDSYCVIGDVTEKYYKKSQLTKMKKDELIELIEQYDENGYYQHNGNKTQLVEDLFEMVTWNKFIQNELNQKRWHDLDCTFDVHGYSQGDIVKVLIIDDAYNYITKKHLTHIFYDCPIEFKFSINGVDYEGYEFLDDEYEYDKNDVMKKINKLDISDYAKNWLEENLPSNPEYL